MKLGERSPILSIAADEFAPFLTAVQNGRLDLYQVTAAIRWAGQ